MILINPRAEPKVVKKNAFLEQQKLQKLALKFGSYKILRKTKSTTEKYLSFVS